MTWLLSFQGFFNLIDTQFNSKIKGFRSNNAKELTFTEFFNEQGVVHQFYCVDRPQQNSVVERKHQHLLNIAQAIYFQSRVPIQFWTECILIVTFLINRTPSPLLNNRTPYELLYKTVMDYSSFRVLDVLLLLRLYQLNRQSLILQLEFVFSQAILLV